MLKLRIVCGILYKEMILTNYNRFRLLLEYTTSKSLLDEEVVHQQLSPTILQLLRHFPGCFLV